MNCPEFEQHLVNWLDSRSSNLPIELQTHASECAACHAQLTAWQRFHQAVCNWKNAEAASDLVDKIVPQPMVGKHQVSLSISAPSRDRFGTSVAALLAAVAIIVMMGIGLRTSNTFSSARRNNTDVPNRAVVRDSSSSVTEPSLDNFLHDARDAYAALATEALHQVSATNVLIPKDRATVPFSSEPVIDGIPESLARPLAPIGSELREAWDLMINRVFSSQDSST